MCRRTSPGADPPGTEELVSGMPCREAQTVLQGTAGRAHMDLERKLRDTGTAPGNIPAADGLHRRRVSMVMEAESSSRLSTGSPPEYR